MEMIRHLSRNNTHHSHEDNKQKITFGFWPCIKSELGISQEGKSHRK